LLFDETPRSSALKPAPHQGYVYLEELLLRNTFMNAQVQPLNFLQSWKEDISSAENKAGN
jgi:hypothetical protein